ncbi:hypothetical protein ACIBAH_35610 [Streptomyces sp. NPDC051445]|uniref:hypothetical protein n=1 Tax=Streptomyces sp. NPDC051445 TaxID=3365653 RepID=UPI0037B6EEBA
MKYQQRLQVAVRERLRKLMTAPFSSAGHEVHLAVTWIKSQPALRGLLEEAARKEPDLDREKFQAGLSRSGRFFWPSRTEEGRASLVWELMQDIAKAEAEDPEAGWRVASDYSPKSSLQDSWREFAGDVLQPLFDFLSERVGAESSILHTLERYRTRIEWFDREELYTRFEADRANGGEVYNLDLQRFLFLEGDHITHAKPRSASGEADLIGDLDGRDPLVCDGKIFDGKGRGKGGKVMDLSAQELVTLWAKGGPSEVTLPPDGEFVRQLRTEDHFRSFIRKMQGLIKDGVYTAKGSFDKSHADRTDSEKIWEGLTDLTGFLTEGIYGASPASMALGSYNLDYELLGVACEPPKTDSEWDHGALVGQARVSISNTSLGDAQPLGRRVQERQLQPGDEGGLGRREACLAGRADRHYREDQLDRGDLCSELGETDGPSSPPSSPPSSSRGCPPARRKKNSPSPRKARSSAPGATPETTGSPSRRAGQAPSRQEPSYN